MELLTPDTGTIIWTFISFLIAFLILKKFAWKPILNALKERENNIANALSAADRAKMEISKLQADNEKLITEARLERDRIIKEARDLKESIISDAKDQAKEEAKKMIEEAKEIIKNEKTAAINDLKKQVAELSIVIAEKILTQELSDPDKEKDLINRSLNEIRFI